LKREKCLQKAVLGGGSREKKGPHAVGQNRVSTVLLEIKEEVTRRVRNTSNQRSSSGTETKSNPLI